MSDCTHPCVPLSVLQLRDANLETTGVWFDDSTTMGFSRISYIHAYIGIGVLAVIDSSKLFGRTDQINGK